MTKSILETAESATSKLRPAQEITDKKGFAARWSFSSRHVDNLLAKGCPHLKIGARRVRIVIADADAWMNEQFRTQRRGPAKPTIRKI